VNFLKAVKVDFLEENQLRNRGSVNIISENALFDGLCIAEFPLPGSRPDLDSENKAQ